MTNPLPARRRRLERLSDRDFVNTFMHHGGTMAHALDDDQFWEVYCLADGFGFLTSEELAQLNDGFDWSHIRDSSPEAFKRMRERIEQFIQPH